MCARVCEYIYTHVSSVVQSHLTLCNPMNCSPRGSSVHGILQARILELPFPSPGDLPNPGIKATFPVAATLAEEFFTAEPPGKPYINMYTHTHTHTHTHTCVYRTSLIAQFVKNPPAKQETPVQFLGWIDPLKKG